MRQIHIASHCTGRKRMKNYELIITNEKIVIRRSTEDQQVGNCPLIIDYAGDLSLRVK